MSRTPRTAKGKRAGSLTEIKPPAPLSEYADLGLPGEQRGYKTASGCTVLLGLEPAKRAPGGIWLPLEEELLWHLSISHAHRYPGWDEIADVRYALVPDGITMALLLPPAGRYVNVEERTFHLWQIDDRRVDGA